MGARAQRPCYGNLVARQSVAAAERLQIDARHHRVARHPHIQIIHALMPPHRAQLGTFLQRGADRFLRGRHRSHLRHRIILQHDLDIARIRIQIRSDQPPQSVQCVAIRILCLDHRHFPLRQLRLRLKDIQAGQRPQVERQLVALVLFLRQVIGLLLHFDVVARLHRVPVLARGRGHHVRDAAFRLFGRDQQLRPRNHQRRLELQIGAPLPQRLRHQKERRGGEIWIEKIELAVGGRAGCVEPSIDCLARLQHLLVVHLRCLAQEVELRRAADLAGLLQ